MERTNPAPLLSGQRGTVVVSIHTDDESATDPELEPLTPYCPKCHYSQAFSSSHPLSSPAMGEEVALDCVVPPPPPPHISTPTPPLQAAAAENEASESPLPLSRTLPERSGSKASLASTVSADVCRICHCESEPDAPLISPCVCSGSLKYVHQSCLQQWIKSADRRSCELCKFTFQMTTKIKPFRSWQKLEMTTVERRKIMCSVTFHIIAITCVIWSLYVQIREGILEWPFWTKLIVVGIGFTGGLVFMYVQCKMYVQLCRRWRAYNRVIYIQDCPNGPNGQRVVLSQYTTDPAHKQVTDSGTGGRNAFVTMVQESDGLAPETPSPPVNGSTRQA